MSPKLKNVFLKKWNFSAKKSRICQHEKKVVFDGQGLEEFCSLVFEFCPSFSDISIQITDLL